MKPHDRAPNGVFSHDLILYGFPEKGGIAAKGFWIVPPDVRGASFDRLNAFQDQVRTLLSLVGTGRRLQLQWSCDADYRQELLAYEAATTSVRNPIVHKVREERFARYWSRMEARQLRRERLALFLSVEISRYSGNLQGKAGLREHFEALFGELEAQFEEFAQTLRTIFQGEATVQPMDDQEHCRYVRDFLNPSLREWNRQTGPALDPALTLQEQCWLGEGIGQLDGGFHLDGHYHAILTLDRWPQCTRPGIVTHLTGLPFLDYRITVNLTPAGTRGEINREEKAIERLQGEYADQRRHSLAVAMCKKERKIENLAGGFVRPFEVTYLIRLWARTKDALQEKVAAMQAAIHAMDGAQYFECSVPTTAKKLFFSSWPGWTHSSYRHRQRYAEDNFLADILPFSATFTGALAEAEAIYDGSHRNLVGLTTTRNNSPQHAVLFGMTGAGKSAMMHDLLLQTASNFDYTVLIEEGLSYKRFTEALQETPIIVHPDSSLTLNYLDTQGLPLTQLHLASAVALLSRMIGIPDSREQLALRSAQLTQYLHQLYRDAYSDWARREPAAATDAAKLACAAHQWRQSMPLGTTPLEAFAEFRDRRVGGDDQAQSLWDSLTEQDLTTFGQNPATEHLVSQTACALFKPEDHPTHGALVDLLAHARLPEHPKAEIDRLATLLRAWGREGAYGQLFDGITNVSLQRSVAHFELGYVPEPAVELKAAIGLLIAGFARQHILSLPRAQRKRIVFEEVARFMDIPGGEKLVAESYAQLRKFNCWAVSIVQQYARFKDSSIRPAVIGNAKQFFLMRQSDRNDLADLSVDLGLPENALEAIQRYPLPEQLSAGQRHSAFCLFTPTSQPPQCGSLLHFEPNLEPSHAEISA
ncbi:MAG: hypothetical protein H7A44_08540 [Opitutaceae bacterium]|nr:hypothetical protein [Cephaloticoccus sp.]MCP5530478.1 hypothetical protein [Opitutaceae bacterium]